MQRDTADGDGLLLTLLQESFPLIERPYADLGEHVSWSEQDVIARIAELKSGGLVRQISAIFDTRRLGYSSTLVALRVEPERIEAVAEIISRHVGVSHNYSRNHDFNLWFTLATPPGVDLDSEAKALVDQPGVLEFWLLPTVKTFKIRVSFDMSEGRAALSATPTVSHAKRPEPFAPADIPLVRILQNDLPLVPRPFQAQAHGTPFSEKDLLRAARRLLETGVMRRYSAILRHRRASYSVNAMTCWHLPGDRVREAGELAATYKAVSHCYERPPHPPRWPYQLFTMIHSRSEEELASTVSDLETAIRPIQFAVLRSGQEFKKTRLRYFDAE